MFGFGKKHSLKGLHIAILSLDKVEHTELVEPWRALRKAESEVYVIGAKHGPLGTLRKIIRGDTIPIDATVDEVRSGAFAALYIPGTIADIKQWKGADEVLDFVRTFMINGKPIAAISSGPGLLALVGSVRGLTLTSSLAVRDDLQRAGAVWVDQKVVTDGHILTGRGPKDLKPFVKQLVSHIAEADA